MFACAYYMYVTDNTLITFLCRSNSPEHDTAVDQEILEKPKFIDLEGTGMLLDTLAKNVCK